jgi:hypothetical protein
MVPCKVALADVVYFRMLTTSVDATVMYCGILQAFGDMFHLGHGRITYTGVQVYITESISKGSLVSKLLAGNGWAATGMLRVLQTLKHSSAAPHFIEHQVNLTKWIQKITKTAWSYQVNMSQREH